MANLPPCPGLVKARSRKSAKRKEAVGAAPVRADAQRVRRLFYGDNLEVLLGDAIRGADARLRGYVDLGRRLGGSISRPSRSPATSRTP
jgi:hypothetical protein